MRTAMIVPMLLLLLTACEESSRSGDTGPPPADAAPGDGTHVGDAAAPDRGADGSATDGPATDGSVSNPNLAKLLGLPGDSWYVAPGTKMRPVCAPSSFGVNGVSGCGAIVTAWGGGAYDPNRQQMLIWGGGHNDYWGNEVYAFDLATMAWQRLTDPSPGPYNKDPLDDGQPVSRHTYDGLQVLSHADRLFGQGGSRATDGNGTRLTWIFDPATKTWSNMQPSGADYPGVGHPYNMSSGYDPKTKKVYMRDPYNLYAYDHANNAWTKLLAWAHAWGPQTGAVDTKRQLFFSLGAQELLVYDIAAKADVTSQWSTSGGDELINAGAPGVDYDSKADALVAWKGGAVWVLEMSTKVWTRKSGTGAPQAAAANGTYGRWRYDAALNVFILVNSVDEDVAFYKHTP